MSPDSTGQQDLRTLLRILWRWKFLLLAFLVLIPLGAYLVERGKPKVYQSSTLMELQDVSSTLGTTGGPVVSGDLDAVARIVTTTPVIDTAAGLLHLPPAVVAHEIAASADPTTGFLTITAQDRNPARAAAIANAFATALARRQTTEADSIIDGQIRGVRNQLRNVRRSDQGERVTLNQQIAQLQALKGSSGSGAQVLQAATPSGTPVSPQTRRAVELALVIALLLGVGAVLLAENTDRRLRTPEDVESLTGWPLLATIPASAFAPEKMPAGEESFQMLRGALTYFNVERPLRSVAVVSPTVGDGKTTVAAGLALATARAGTRAVLVDADLRRPQAASRLGLEAEAGLGAVLAGERELAQVTLEYPVEAPEGKPLLVVPAGPPPPNPIALLGSEAMRRTVNELERNADLVILDSVAALAVSDALPLLGMVSGCIVVVRMNRSSRTVVRRLQRMIEAAHGTVLGVVITGTAPAAGGYGSYYYTEDGSRRGALGLLHLRRKPSAAASVNGRPAADETPPAGQSEVPPPTSARTDR